MKRWCVSVLAACCLNSFCYADVKLWEKAEAKQKVSLLAEGIARYELWDWFEPTGTADNEYGYFFSRARSGLLFNSPLLDARVQLQYTQLFNTPGASSVVATPQGPLGFGPLYFSNTGERFAHSVFIKNLSVDIKDPLKWGLSARIGRFEYSDGTEMLSGDAKLDWVLGTRVSQRLIGPFGFSAFTRSFDGAWVWWDQPKFRVDQLLARPTQGGFEERAGNTIDKIDLTASTLTIKKDVLIPHTQERAFLIRYIDQRAVTQRVDNSGIGTAPRVNVSVDTYGLDLAGAYPHGDNEIDGLFWGALQGGDWYELSHRAYAWDIEGGYQFKKVWAKPWLRLGYYQGSGDSNPGDTLHETFFQVLPTARQYAFFPLHNMMNNHDLFAQFLVKPCAPLTIRADWHWLTLDARADRLYGGSGASQEKGGIFGYFGRNGSNKYDVGNLLDVSVTYDPKPWLKISAYYGHIFGGAVLDKIYPNGSDADFFFTEVGLKF